MTTPAITAAITADNARPTFTRICTPKVISAYVKEAKRVGYTVNSSMMSARNAFSHKVSDPENAEALVFRAVQVRPGVWCATFSTVYFQDSNA